jgi:hypothetical protein
MNRRKWQDWEGHPSADLLLLHLEDELAGPAAHDIRAHIDQCGACRLSCEELELGMSRFAAFRDTAVLPAPGPRPKALRALLVRMEAEGSSVPLIDRLRGLLRINTPGRIAFVCSAASLCLVAWISVFLSAPRQSVYASQLLDDARVASDSLMAHSKVLNQKIRLRRGNLVIERNVHHGRLTPMQAQDSRIDSQLQQELDLAHVKLNDPLNASDFAEWRSAQRGHVDSVKETAQGFIITTRLDGAAIREGSITLSRSDWRPIARSVEVSGEAPIEISEVSYDLSDSLPSKSESAIGALVKSGPSSVVAPAATAEVSVLDLETSELDLREAFHSIGADVSANPEIWTADQTVFFHTSTQKPGETAAIRKAASRIPHVEEAGKQPARLAVPLPPFNEPGSYATTPPLAGELQAKLGDAQAVSTFLESFRTRSSHVLAEAAALEQLGKRYPDDKIKTLPPDLRARVNRLAASMLSSLQHDSSDYVKSLSPVLDDMAHDLNIPSPGDNSSSVPGCLPWQDNATLAEPHLRDLTKDVSLLLMPSQTDEPDPLPASKLMADSLKARSFLEVHLMSTCQLFGAS